MKFCQLPRGSGGGGWGGAVCVVLGFDERRGCCGLVLSLRGGEYIEVVLWFGPMM